jgi:hypothetical protein
MEQERFITVDKWFQHWEVWVTAILIILTLLIGLFGTPIFSYINIEIYLSIVLAFLEFIFGVAIFIVRRVSSELEKFSSDTMIQISELRKSLIEHSELAKNTLDLNDPEIISSILKITSTQKQARKNPLLYKILKNELERKASELKEMESSEGFNMWESGDITPIQNKLQYYMEALTEGCSYFTISNLKFWSGQEISQPSDFLRFNYECAVKRGVNFQRIFLLNKTFSDLTSSEVELFKEHNQITQKSKGKIKTFVIEADEYHSNDIKEYGNFSIWLSEDSRSQLLLNMVYENDGNFNRLEVSKQRQEIDRYYQRFHYLLSRAEPIDNFLRRNSVI